MVFKETCFGMESIKKCCNRLRLSWRLSNDFMMLPRAEAKSPGSACFELWRLSSTVLKDFSKLSRIVFKRVFTVPATDPTPFWNEYNVLNNIPHVLGHNVVRIALKGYFFKLVVSGSILM